MGMSGMPNTGQNTKASPYGAMFCSYEKLYFGKIFNDIKCPYKISKGKKHRELDDMIPIFLRMCAYLYWQEIP